MNIYVDIGNTHIKWLSCSSLSNAVVAKNTDELISQLAVFSSSIKHIYCASVRGSDFDSLFMEKMEQALACAPVFFLTEPEFAGVRCAYKEFQRLGVDRWLALLAAKSRCAGKVVVIDVGTAMTIDALDEEGLHLGGYIVPGLARMVDSLNVGTSLINVDLNDGLADVALGDSTERCVLNGCVAMMLSLIKNTLSTYVDAKLVFTGGGCQYLPLHQFVGHEYRPNLVLEGLIYVASEKKSIRE